MSDITEEEIARALVEFQFPGCGEDEATVASHLPMARAVLTVVQPALERARVVERERLLASAATSQSELLTARYMDEPWYSGVVAMHDALAAAIRKG